jgi:hypothetical protein
MMPKVTQTIQESAGELEYRRCLALSRDRHTRQVHVIADGDIDPGSPIAQPIQSFACLSRGSRDVPEFEERFDQILDTLCSNKENRHFQIDVAGSAGDLHAFLGRGPGKGGNIAILSPRNPCTPTWTRAEANPVLSLYVNPESQTLEAAASKPIIRGSAIHRALEECLALPWEVPGRPYMDRYSNVLRVAKKDPSVAHWDIITEHHPRRQREREEVGLYFKALERGSSTVCCSEEEAYLMSFPAIAAPSVSTQVPGPCRGLKSNAISTLQNRTASPALTGADSTFSNFETVQKSSNFSQTASEDLMRFMLDDTFTYAKSEDAS